MTARCNRNIREPKKQATLAIKNEHNFFDLSDQPLVAYALGSSPDEVHR